MSRPPYPVNNTGPPYPDPNAQNAYGQPAQGGLPYPTGATSGPMPYPQAPNPNQQAYPQQNLPYGMPTYPPNALPPGGPGASPYPNYTPEQQGNTNVYPTQMPPPYSQQNPQHNTPYQPTAYPGQYGSQPPPPAVPSAPYLPEPTTGGGNAGIGEHNKGPGKGLFSKSGFLGKAFDKAGSYVGGIPGQSDGHGGGTQGGASYGGGGFPGEKTPFCWSSQDKSYDLDLSENNMEIHYSGRNHQGVDDPAPMVRADRPFPKHRREGQFYFEVSIVNVGRNKEIAVGISVREASLDQFPGWERYSFGYHGDDGNIYCECDDAKHCTEKPFKSGDVIGVCLDFTNASLCFSKNGKEVKKVRLSRQQMEQEYYPSVGTSSPGAVVRAIAMSSDGAFPPSAPQQGYHQQQYQNSYPPPHQQPYHQQPYQQQHGAVPAPNNGLLSNCQGRKKALLIGINYFGTGSELRGCINDVNNIKKLIKARGFREDSTSMRTLTDDNRNGAMHPTRRNIIEGMHWLVSGASPGDSLFLHYSGHGSQAKDHDGDEVDGYDETICPVDHKSAGEIVDDEMNAILVRQLPRGVRLTAIFDSCHSATALDLPFVYDCDGNIKKQKVSRKNVGMNLLETGMALKSGNIFQAFQAGSQTLNDLTNMGNEHKAQEITEETRSSQGDVVMFAGCKDYQTSADTSVQGYGATGAASYSFIDALSRGDNPTYIDLLARMRETLRSKYSQVVQMSTGFETDMNTPFIF